MLEAEHPELTTPDSPSLRVGSDLSGDFPEAAHTVPVLSLDKAYSHEELSTWVQRTSDKLAHAPVFVVEEKLDGVSIVLYYEQGVLMRAVTRGNGSTGNDVTGNVRTIRDVPLRLQDDVDIAVRGEILLPLAAFRRLNERMETPYANPRNLAAGTLRRVKSRETAEVPLRFFAYEGFLTDAPASRSVSTHRDMLVRLARLGFRVNPHMGLFSEQDVSSPFPDDAAELPAFSQVQTGTLADLEHTIAQWTAARESREYEIDGLVVKLDDLSLRDELGYTGHHPRWAIAYKFESPVSVTKVRAIDVQVGRTGRITPVARVEPVGIGGTTVSNVTLHNQAYIEALELHVGDTVEVSRRGDVIPAVERVIEPNPEAHPYPFPTRCPTCGSALEERGAHHFCPNFRCPDRMRGQLHFFVASAQMDIQHLGSETLNLLLAEGIVEEIPDLFCLDYEHIAGLPGFGARKIELLKGSIEHAKSRPYRTVLASLGIPDLGPKFVELVCEAGYHSIDDLLQLVDEERVDSLIAIDGVGEKTAARVAEELARPSVRSVIQRLREAGLQFSEERAPDTAEPAEAQIFAGESWCITGSFETFQPRSLAAEKIRSRGGTVVSDVSGKTTHLLAGANAGSKRDKAEKRGVEIVDEQEFLRRLAATDDA